MFKRNLLNRLPRKTVEEIEMVLKAYDECHVIYQNGKHEVMTDWCLKDEYPMDYKYIGELKAKDIFSKEELIENYINTFCSYPVKYNNKKDYAMLRKMETEKTFDFENNTMTKWVGKINNQGIFELTKKITISI